MPKSKRLPTPRHRCGAVTLLLMQPPQDCCHCSHRLCAVTMLPPLPLPPLPRYCSRHQASATAPPPSFGCCHHRCHAIAMLPLPLLPLLPHCRCGCQAAATKLPPPSCRSCRCQAAAAAAAAPLPSCRRGHHCHHACRNKTLYVRRNT
jgi:hypothetical protein